MRRLPLLCLLLVLGCGASRVEQTPRSIVLVLIDTLRRDALPMFGGETRTPHLSGLAERGIARPALASFHQTSMSMGALFTGRTPSLESGDANAALAWQPASWCGMGRFASADEPAGSCLPAALPTLGEALRQRGYHSVGVVGNALLHEPAGFARGFDRWVEVGQRPEDVNDPAHPGAQKKKRAVIAARRRGFEKIHAALRAELAELPDAPVFLYVHYLDVHDWLYRDMSYAEAVEHMDRGIGELLELLDASGLGDAAILVTSDHGELIEDRKRVVRANPLHLGNPSFRDVLEIPLLLVGAGDLPLPDPIRSEDVHRILLTLAGATPGSSPDLADDELFVTEKHYRTYQRGRFKSFQERAGHFTLIDLEGDPGETRDAAAQHPEVVRAHRERVDVLTRTLGAGNLPTEPAPLDAEWTERLHSLGYVE